MGLDISEETRLKLALFSSVASLICIIPSLMVFSAGLYIQVAVQTKIRLIEGFDVAALPGYLITVGLLSLVYNSTSAALVFLSRKKKKRLTFSHRLLPLVICGLILFGAIFAAGCICFIQITHLDQSFKKGIFFAMKDYKTDVKMKEEIDLLQIDYECCGSENYSDWFNVEWMHEDFVKKTKKTDKEVTDDVPFSCCDPNSMRPCINYNVHSDNVYHNYNYNNYTTLHTKGCRHALVDFYGYALLTDVGALVIAISFLQISSVVLTRLVQTSIITAIQKDDPFSTATGYIFFNRPTAGDSERAEEEWLISDDDVYESTFDETSDDAGEFLVSREPLYANISLHRRSDRTARLKSLEPIYSDTYEIPYVGGGRSPTSPRNAKSSKRPSLPQFAPPPPPTTQSPPKLPMTNQPTATQPPMAPMTQPPPMAPMTQPPPIAPMAQPPPMAPMAQPPPMAPMAQPPPMAPMAQPPPIAPMAQPPPMAPMTQPQQLTPKAPPPMAPPPLVPMTMSPPKPPTTLQRPNSAPSSARLLPTN